MRIALPCPARAVPSGPKKSLALFLLIFLSSPVFTSAQVVSPADDAQAEMLAKKYSNDGVICLSSHQYFTFDKGKNALADKVVTIQEDADLEFMSLKKFSVLTYPEYYNKFIQLKTFRKADKYFNKYVTSARSGVDRSVTDEGIFFDDSRVQYYPMRFYARGASAKITVKKEYGDGKYLTRLFFHESYPVLEQVFEFKVPTWLTVEFKPMNFEGYNIEKKETTKSGYTTYLFTMRNVPAYKSEYKEIGRAYSDPHILIQIKSFESKGEVLKGFDNVGDVYNWNNRLYEMAGNNNDKLKPTLDNIIAGAKTDDEKIRKIYYWVQDKIRYIAYEDGYSGYIPTAAQDVLGSKYGDCKGMANLLTEFLQLAGFDAHFTWIGTRALPYPQTLPVLCVNNHAISTLYYKNKEYFLDATEKYAPFGENAYRIQGKDALIAKGNKYEIKTVPLLSGSEHKIMTKADFTMEADKLKGQIQVTLTGNERKDFHQIYHDLPLSSREKFLNSFLEFNNDNVQASGIKTSDLDNREIPVSISGKIELNNAVHQISTDKYVNLDFFPKTLLSYMPDDKRTKGYDLDYVLSFEDEFSLTIPAGQRFADIPAKLELDTDNYDFSGEYIVSGNKITLKKRVTIKKSSIPKSDFDNWKKYLESIQEFSSYFFSITGK